MELEGKIIQKFPEQGGTSKAGNPWRKQEYLLETFGNYPQKVVFNFFNDRIDQNVLEPGKSYAVTIEISSREFNGRWYTDVRGLATRPLMEGVMPQQPQQPAYQPQQPQQPTGFAPQAPADPFSNQGPAAGGFAAPQSGDDLPF